MSTREWKNLKFTKQQKKEIESCIDPAKIEVIRRLQANMSTEDLDPKIVKMVNKHFYDLINK